MRGSWAAHILRFAAVLTTVGCAERHLVVVHGEETNASNWRTGPRSVRGVEFSVPRPHPSGDIVHFAAPIPTTFDGKAAVPADP